MKLHEKIKNHYKENYASSPIEIFNEEIDFIIKHECKCDNCGKSIFEMENYPETRDNKLLCDDCYDDEHRDECDIDSMLNKLHGNYDHNIGTYFCCPDCAEKFSLITNFNQLHKRNK